jgi:hypothetical protein
LERCKKAKEHIENILLGIYWTKEMVQKNSKLQMTSKDSKILNCYYLFDKDGNLLYPNLNEFEIQLVPLKAKQEKVQ